MADVPSTGIGFEKKKNVGTTLILRCRRRRRTRSNFTIHHRSLKRFIGCARLLIMARDGAAAAAAPPPPKKNEPKKKDNNKMEARPHTMRGKSRSP